MIADETKEPSESGILYQTVSPVPEPIEERPVIAAEKLKVNSGLVAKQK